MGFILSSMLWFASALAQAQPLVVPEDSRQLIVGVGADTESSTVELQRYQRAGPTHPWKAVGDGIPARIGKRGMAWGRGLHGTGPTDARAKREGDWRAPMGVFRIGKAFGDAKTPPPTTTWPYTQVTENDLWVEDVSAPTYNQHIQVPKDRPRTEWEEGQRMKMGDPAHRLKIVIHHNTGPHIVPGAGSAIFFHIWRSAGSRPTSGCTAMDADQLEMVLQWLKPDAAAVYVLADTRWIQAAKAAGTLP